METVHIHRLTTRYRLTPSARAERQRLDAVMKAVFEEALEQALARVGVSIHEEICIRRIHVPVRLRLSKPDSALVLAWSIVLAEAIKQTVERNDTGDVVRYGSRVQALIDLAMSIARDDYRRAWAWRQLDLWRETGQPTGSAAARALLVALTREARLLPPVLHALAETNYLKVLAGRFGPEQWVVLAAAALNTVGMSTDLLEMKDDEFPPPMSADLRRRAHHLLTVSPLTRVLASLPISTAQTRRALSVLIVLDAEPNALHASETANRALIATVSEALEIVTTLAAIETRSEELLPFVRRGEGAELQGTAGQNPSSAEVGFLAWEDEPEPQTASTAFPVPLVRRQAFTSFGGLLFLLGVVDDLGLPAEMSTHPDLARRLTRWVLHQLALTLVPAEADDPAVLAFAGLPPETEPPWLHEEPATVTEVVVIAAYAARIREAVRERLNRRDPDEALQFVCHRHAVIVADPGWIEVHFALTDVSVEIRRAALDLDLDYLPWLGVVVKFVYE